MTLTLALALEHGREFHSALCVGVDSVILAHVYAHNTQRESVAVCFISILDEATPLLINEYKHTSHS